MRAVVIREFGPAEVLVPTEVPDPIPAGGEVLVDVDLANVTFVETHVRAGTPPHPSMLPSLPTVLGNGVGGVVAAAGAGVDPAIVGRQVVSSLAGSGGYAERALAPASRLIAVPDGVGIRDAVALLADGRTALSLVRRADPREDETVLVEAAAGGVGTLLVQLARMAGRGSSRLPAASASSHSPASWGPIWPSTIATSTGRRARSSRRRPTACGRLLVRSSSWRMRPPRTRRSRPARLSARRC